MDQQQFTIVKINSRLIALQTVFVGLLGVVGRTAPDVADALREAFQRLRIRAQQIALKGLPPEQSDMVSAEVQEALDDFLDEIESEWS